MRGERAFQRFLAKTAPPCRVLDIGSGAGEHAALLFDRGYEVTTIDTARSSGADVIGEYELNAVGAHNASWACHVLEHSPNPGFFLRKLASETLIGGLVSVTVPPLKAEIVGGHLTLWNAGLLLYNLVRAGFDCSNAAVLTDGYDVTVQVFHVPILRMPPLANDHGDIERLADYFPLPVAQGFDGNIPVLNW